MNDGPRRVLPLATSFRLSNCASNANGLAAGRPISARRHCPGVNMPIVYNFRVKLRWWVMPYLRLCRYVTACGIAMDLDRVKANVLSGIRVSSRRLSGAH